MAVEADLSPDVSLGTAMKAIHALPLAGDMLTGTAIEQAGDAEVMGAGVLPVYVVLVLLFSSFITPITILLFLPLAIGGAIFALFLRICSDIAVSPPSCSHDRAELDSQNRFR